MRKVLLLTCSVVCVLLSGGCAKYWDMAEERLAAITPPPMAAGPAERWISLRGDGVPASHNPDFHAAFARCYWMAERGMLDPVSAGQFGPRVFAQANSHSGQPGPLLPAQEEQIGQWWPTEARLAPCMREAGFAPAPIPQRRF